MTAAARIAEKPVAQREITITRVFDAPRALVFSMWTDAKHLAACGAPMVGPIRRPRRSAPRRQDSHHMQAPDGSVHPMRGLFDESCPTTASCSRRSSTCRTARCARIANTAMFADEGRKTKVPLHAKAAGFTDFSANMARRMEAGWSQSLDKLVVTSHARPAPGTRATRRRSAAFSATAPMRCSARW